MTIFTAHLLAAYAILGMPGFAWVWYQKAKRQIAAADPEAKLRLYHKLVFEQTTTAAVVLGLWIWGGISASALGLVAPHALPWNMALLAVLFTYLVWSAFRLRPKIEKIRQRLEIQLGALIPGSNLERRWFGAVSIGAGVSEELVFRGFLFYYLGLYLPHSNALEKVILTSLIFGVAHFYQGLQGIIGATLLGLIAAGIYVMSGSLLLPVVLHAVVDWRLLLAIPPEAPPAALMASKV
jgi:uncharacterized protein